MIDLVKLSERVLNHAIDFYIAQMEDDDIDTDYTGVSDDALPQISKELNSLIDFIGKSIFSDIIEDVNDIEQVAASLFVDIFGLGDGLECHIKDSVLKDAYNSAFYNYYNDHYFGKSIIIGDDKKLYLE